MNKLRYLLGIALILGGLAFLVWLSIYVMLYGGIMAAINAWGVCNSTVVWGIIRAIFFELGMIPGGMLVLTGKGVIAAGLMRSAQKRMYSRFGRSAQMYSRFGRLGR